MRPEFREAQKALPQIHKGSGRAWHLEGSLCSPTGPGKGSVPKGVQVPTHLVHTIVQGHDCQVLDVFALLGALQFYQQVVPLPVSHA